VTEFLAAFIIFAIATAAMAIGVMIGRKGISGSCGGLANMRDEHGRTLCDACSNPSPECRGEPLQQNTPSADDAQNTPVAHHAQPHDAQDTRPSEPQEASAG